MRKLFIGILIGLLVPVVACLVIYWVGIDIAATTPTSKLEEKVSRLMLDRSLALAPNQAAPKATDVGTRDGLKHYKANCIMCHGAPGIEAAELAKGLNPAAPNLAKQETQRRTDGELFWIISHGIRMTGMPGFAPTHKESELWNIVNVLRKLPNLSAEEKKFLSADKEIEHHHEHSH